MELVTGLKATVEAGAANWLPPLPSPSAADLPKLPGRRHRAAGVARMLAAWRLCADLLEDDPAWRNKLLKDVQYSCRVVAVAIAGKDAATAGRLKHVGSALSLARRIMILGECVEDARDAARAVRGAQSLASWEFAAASTGAVNGAMDDVLTLAAIKLIPPSWIPDWLERSGEVMWTVNTTVLLMWALVKLRRTTDPFKRWILVVSVCKYVADLGQAIPGALDVDSPKLYVKKECVCVCVCVSLALFVQISAFGLILTGVVAVPRCRFDYMCGLASGLLSTYKIWAKASHAAK